MHPSSTLYFSLYIFARVNHHETYNFDPLRPHFYIVKLGFTGIYIIFLIFAQNIDCGYSLEPPLRGGSNKYPQSMFWAEIWKISDFLYENFLFLVVKFSICLNRHVFVMCIRNVGIFSLNCLNVNIIMNMSKFDYPKDIKKYLCHE